MPAKYINLACGRVFLNSSEWANFDFVAVPGVQKANLLGRLPLPNSTARLVYASHFLEHIPKPQVGGFLRECLRVLEPDGVIRLVLPDLENMARTYLQLRSEGRDEQANFLVLEIIDQCVRKQSGGELGKYYQNVLTQATNSETGSVQDTLMIDFIKHRTGEAIGTPNRLKPAAGGVATALKQVLRAVPRRLQSCWTQAVLLALPTAFREQNVSFAGVGERHHWLWDFQQLQQALESVGFIAVERRTADSSAIRGFPFHPLDLDTEGRPRKGAQSMYIEARKPKYVCCQ
jgi:SAM-dependent methyltransferase